MSLPCPIDIGLFHMNPAAVFFQLRAFVKTKLTHVIQEKKYFKDRRDSTCKS